MNQTADRDEAIKALEHELEQIKSKFDELYDGISSKFPTHAISYYVQLLKDINENLDDILSSQDVF